MMLSKLIKSVIVLNVVSLVFVTAFTGSTAQASTSIPYYGDEFYNDLKSGVSDLDLEISLKKVLLGSHIVRQGQNDLIVKSCEGSESSCYWHRAVGYKAARVFVMTGSDVIHDTYCDISVETNRGMPKNANLNVEHTWPQSRFNKAYRKDLQKSDVHHLFPTDSNTNMIRGNHIFGEVTADTEELSCKASRFGLGSAGAQDVFQPPANHRGNVARALFYFAVRYDLNITGDEEKILRKWHEEDPVDQQEIDRNEVIFEMQLNRNPFIDFPELVERLSDF